MAFNPKIIPLIDKEFPTLLGSQIHIFKRKVQYEERDKMLPYLILKNTVDDKKRGIITFQNTSSDHYKLTPIFVAVGIAMRTKVNIVTPNEEWKKEKFRYQGDIVTFEKMELESDTMFLKGGVKTKAHKLLDFRVYAEPLNSSGKQRVEELVKFIESEKWKASDSISKHLLKLKGGDHKLEGGVLVITRKGKFKEILKSVKIDDKKLSDLMDIRVTKWKSNSENYTYPSIFGNTHVSNQPLVLVAGYEEFGAVEEFIKKFPNISSVVFDDAGDFTKKFDSSQFDRFKNKFIHSDKFRDAYFVMDQADLGKKDLIEGFISDLIPVFSWMSTDADINNSFEPNSINLSLVEEISRVPFDISRDCFQELFSNGFIDLVFPFFEEFRDFIRRWNSFYDSGNLESTAQSLIRNLDNIIVENKDRFRYIEQITDRLKEQLDNFQTNNLKFAQFQSELDKYKIDEISRVYVLSENTNTIDQNYLLEKIGVEWSQKIKFLGYDEVFRFEGDSIIIAFGSHRNFSSNILHKCVKGKIHLILDCKDLWYFRLTYFKTTKLLKNVLDRHKRHELLNMSDDMDVQDDVLPFEPLNVVLNEMNKSCHLKEKDNLDKQKIETTFKGLDFLEFLGGEEQEHSNTGNNTKHDSPEVGLRIIGLDDGSTQIYEKSKYLYALDTFDEEDESLNMSDAVAQLRKKVDNLNEGDFIVIFPTDKPADLQSFVESQIEANFVLNTLNSKAESWRTALNEIYVVLGRDMSQFTQLLSKHIQRSEQTFKNWLSGYTMVPDTDKRDNQDVLETLADLVSTDLRFKHIKFNFDEGLRGQMKKMKRIKVNAPRMLLKRAVYERINLNVDIEDSDQRDFIKSLSEKLEVKQIKSIQDI